MSGNSPQSSHCGTAIPAANSRPVPETLEAEVIEIDGKRPPFSKERTSKSRIPWSQFSRRVMRFDRRWWPLWLILGSILLAVVLTAGAVLGACYLLVALVGRMARSIHETFR